MEEYKLIIAGGREFSDRSLLFHTLDNLIANDLKDFSVSIVSGMAKGADKLGYEYAKAKKLKVYAKYAKWNELGKSAGFIRNSEMANMSDGVIAFWDKKSPGTKHMIDTMVKLEKDVWVQYY